MVHVSRSILSCTDDVMDDDLGTLRSAETFLEHRQIRLRPDVVVQALEDQHGVGVGGELGLDQADVPTAIDTEQVDESPSPLLLAVHVPLWTPCGYFPECGLLHTNQRGIVPDYCLQPVFVLPVQFPFEALMYSALH